MEVASTTLRRPGGARRNGAVLLARVERAEQRDDIDGFVGDALLQQRLGAADFAGARQEHQQPSRYRRAARAARRRPPGSRCARARRGRDSASPPRKRGLGSRPPARRRAAPPRGRRRASPTSPGFSDPRAGPAARRCASASPRSASSERSWNSSNSTAATPSSDGSSRTSRVNTPSVITSMRVRLEIFEPKRTRKPTVSPTCSPSVEAMRAGGGARGQPARLQHQDFLILRPRLVEQHQRHARGLAGARRRHQHGGVVRAQRRGEPRQRLVDGKRCVEILHDVTSSSGSGWPKFK